MARTASTARGGWLFKEEPDSYTYADLERDGDTVWEGVTNNLALKNLRHVQPDDRVLFYQTGKEKAIVGEMRVVAGPGPDPRSDDAKRVVVTVAPVKRWRRPLTLAEIKSDPELAGWDLVRLPRLSVVRVEPAVWRRLEELAAQ